MGIYLFRAKCSIITYKINNKVSNLEVGVLEDIGGCVKVLDLLERAHDLLPDHAALLIHQLYGGSLSIMGHTVPHLNKSLLIAHCDDHSFTHHHVELVLVILHTEHHGHGLANLDNAAHLTGIGALTNLQQILCILTNSLLHQKWECDLNLHPASEIVPEEVGGDGVQHVHLVRLEGDRLLIEVIPGIHIGVRYLSGILHCNLMFSSNQ